MSHTSTRVYIDNTTTPPTGITPSDVGAVITRSTGDVGQLCGDMIWDDTLNNGNGGWRRANAINKWSKCKSVGFDTMSANPPYDQTNTDPLTIQNNRGQYALMRDAHYGFHTGGGEEGAIWRFSIMEIVKALHSTGGIWIYYPPTGIADNEMYRLLDFNEYHHNAVAPDTYVFPADTLGTEPTYGYRSQQGYQSTANVSAELTYNTNAELKIEEFNIGQTNMNDMYIAFVWHEYNDDDPDTGFRSDRSGIIITDVKLVELAAGTSTSSYIAQNNSHKIQLFNIPIPADKVYECCFILVDEFYYDEYVDDPTADICGLSGAATMYFPDAYFKFKYNQIPIEVNYWLTNVNGLSANYASGSPSETSIELHGILGFNFDPNRDPSVYNQRFKLHFTAKTSGGTEIPIVSGADITDQGFQLPQHSSSDYFDYDFDAQQGGTITLALSQHQSSVILYPTIIYTTGGHDGLKADFVYSQSLTPISITVE